MKVGDRDQDTICAIATPPGVGGISVLRVSGPLALQQARLLAPFLPEKLETHRVYHGILTSNSAGHEGHPIDEVLISYFQKGKSFTGEDTVEISCHGNPQICQRILKELVSCGARPADRGEFTYRAFMNGKMDLVQAESVLSLIESQSEQSSRQALRQLRGELSKSLYKVEADILWILAHLEVGIDFSTEGVEVVPPQEMQNRLVSTGTALASLLAGYQTGKMIQDGLRVVFVGAPNVGKSSLLNLLAEEEKAIVTDMPGTTRDLVEATFFINGVKVCATDTAGLRSTTDAAEKIGIERTYKALGESDRALFIFDLKKGLSEAELKELEAMNPQTTYLLGNKKDQFKGFLDEVKKGLAEQLKTLKNFQKSGDFDKFMKTKVLFVSAFDKTSSAEIKSLLQRDFEGVGFEDQAYISQARHFENISKAFENFDRALMLFKSGASSEFLALEIKEALISVQETLGKRFDDQIMDRVFKEFCIGK